VLKATRHLDYVVLICDDLGSMRRFYEGVMEFPVHRELGPSWIELRVGASIVALRPRDRAYDGPAPAADSAGVQLAFRVAPGEVDACHTELVERGTPILDPPTDQVWGHRTLFFADPEHNVLEIYAEI
jgi:catechol 2,3-dioxygenase-like lactoylglutathione lyase family enzyme